MPKTVAPVDDDDEFVPLKPEAARAQAAEYLNVLVGVDFDLGGGEVWHLPNLSFLPPAMKKRHSEHQRFMNEDVDKHRDETVNPVTKKKQVVEKIKWPVRFNDVLIDEDELLCVALMGEDAVADREKYFADGTLPDKYARFLEAGGVPGQVQVHWQVMITQLAERMRRDSKSR